MLSGANAFEISDIERMNIGTPSAGRLGGNNVTCPVVTRNNNSPGTGQPRRTFQVEPVKKALESSSNESGGGIFCRIFGAASCLRSCSFLLK